ESPLRVRSRHPGPECPDRTMPRSAFGEAPMSFFEQPDDEQENHRADYGVDDCRNDAADEDKPDQRQQPARNDCADNADNDIADKAEAVALDDQTPEPTSNRSDDQPNDERLDH